jgi:hypothetical protein
MGKAKEPEHLPIPCVPDILNLLGLLPISPNSSLKAGTSAAVTHSNTASAEALSVSGPKVLLWECKLTSTKSKFPIGATALIDSGASLCLIHEHLVDHLHLKQHTLPHVKLITTVTQQKVSLTHYITLPLSSINLEYKVLPVQLIVTPLLSHDIVLGMYFLCKNAIHIDVANNKVWDSQVSYILVGHPEEHSQVLQTPYIPPGPSPKCCKQEWEWVERAQIVTTRVN